MALTKSKQVSLSVSCLCCASINLRTSGSNPGCDLSHKLQQHLTCWGPLHDCEDMVDMIACIESLGSGSLLELASLHGIQLDVNTSCKDELCAIIMQYLILGGCQTTNAVTHENNLSDICTNHYNIQSPEPGREWKIREVR